MMLNKTMSGRFSPYMKWSFLGFLFLIGILFLSYSAQDVLGDEELVKMETRYKKMYEDYLKAMDVIKNQTRYSLEEIEKAKNSRNLWNRVHYTLGAELKEKGGSPGDIRKQVKSAFNQKRTNIKGPEDNLKQKVFAREDLKRLRGELAKRENELKNVWGDIKYHLDRIDNYLERIEKEPNKKSRYVERLHTRIDSALKDINRYLGRAESTIRIALNGKIEAIAVDDKKVVIQGPGTERPWKLPAFAKKLRRTSVADQALIELHLKYTIKLEERFSYEMREKQKVYEKKYGPKNKVRNPLNEREYFESEKWGEFEAEEIIGRRTVYYINKYQMDPILTAAPWLKDLEKVYDSDKLAKKYDALQDAIRAQLLTINKDFTVDQWEVLRVKMKKLLKNVVATEKKIYWLLGSSIQASPEDKVSEEKWLEEFRLLVGSNISMKRKEVIKAYVYYKEKERYYYAIKLTKGLKGTLIQEKAKRQYKLAKAEWEVKEREYFGGYDKETKKNVIGIVQKAEEKIQKIIHQRYKRAEERAKSVSPNFRVHTEFETKKDIRFDWEELTPFVKDKKNWYFAQIRNRAK